MAGKTQEALVTDQFGPQAKAYVTSAVHAGGADLDQIETLVRGQVHARVLDLGCGGGHVSYRVAPHVREVVAYDLSARDAGRGARDRRGARPRQHRDPSQGAAEAIPFPAASFDLVLSRYSAHHWHDFVQGLREARRVLKPGGRAVFIDAVTPGAALLDTFLQSIELLRDPSHVRNYTRERMGAGAASGGLPAGRGDAAPPAPRFRRLGQAHAHAGDPCPGDPLFAGADVLRGDRAFRHPARRQLHAGYDDDRRRSRCKGRDVSRPSFESPPPFGGGIELAGAVLKNADSRRPPRQEDCRCCPAP